MGLIKRGLLFLLSILFLIIAIILVIAVNINSLTHIEFYQDSFNKANFYNNLINQLSENQKENNYFIFSEDEVKTLVDGTLINLLDYLKGEKSSIDLKIQLNNSKIYESINKEIESLEDCQNGIGPTYNGELICRYADLNSTQFLDKLIKENKISISNESFDLVEILKMGPGSNGAIMIENIREIVSLFKSLLVLFAVIFALIIFFIYLLHKNSSKGFILNLGINLIIVGIILFCLSFYVENIVNKNSLSLDPLFSSVLIVGLSKILYGILIYSLTIFLVGLFFFITGIIKRKSISQS